DRPPSGGRGRDRVRHLRHDHPGRDGRAHDEPRRSRPGLRPGLRPQRRARREGPHGAQQQPWVRRAERLDRFPRNVRRASILAAIVLSACAPRAGNSPVDSPDSLSARREIWTALQPMARERGIEPGFVYAIIKLESNFDPRARRGEARGLMQIKPKAWRAVSESPYDPAVWDWRTNMRVGVDGLAAIKRQLAARGVFSYPLLWA